MCSLLILLFALLLALLLDVKLWLFPLFLITFVFLSNVTHDDYSFLVGLSLKVTDATFMCSAIVVILPLVPSIAQCFEISSGSAKIRSLLLEKIPYFQEESLHVSGMCRAIIFS